MSDGNRAGPSSISGNARARADSHCGQQCCRTKSMASPLSARKMAHRVANTLRSAAATAPCAGQLAGSVPRSVPIRASSLVAGTRSGTSSIQSSHAERTRPMQLRAMATASPGIAAAEQTTKLPREQCFLLARWTSSTAGIFDANSLAQIGQLRMDSKRQLCAQRRDDRFTWICRRRHPQTRGWSRQCCRISPNTLGTRIPGHISTGGSRKRRLRRRAR